ncbi:MAG: hypothetical protein CME34_08295 [Gordonia sp.]|uniref:hypothetical protein n=1 Tax=Gordonia sp. (in: high G+C Gram-positive bacteria) TaxID=84139 RepID=UPI000C4A8537|nr:hypothetical protein [Gordonia sp. (in: high G+C Gram-positive bacteria)]MAU81857.1 hypothetical protein [Gordonia sp. (in: high G+C Gram-positive bacteria)]
MTSVIMVAIGAAMLVVAAFAFRLTSRVGAVAILLGAISLGLAYDNIAVAVGRLVGYGDTLSAINLPRFWIHAIAVPLLIVVAGNLVGRLGVEQARTRNVTLGGWALVVMLMVIGFVEDVVRLDLEPEDAGDALRYVNAGFDGPPLPAIITVLAVLVLGVMAFRYAGFPWLFVGALVMLIAAPIGTMLLWVGNLGELVLMLSMLVTMAAVGGLPVPTTRPIPRPR